MRISEACSAIERDFSHKTNKPCDNAMEIGKMCRTLFSCIFYWMGVGVASAQQGTDSDPAQGSAQTAEQSLPPNDSSAVVGAGASYDAVPVANATAEAEPATTRERSSTNSIIEEVVVTAQKREENVQNVPISISAFSAEKLEALGVKSADQLGKITPGLTFSNQAGYSLIFLRGVGNNAFLPSADPVVPIYLDGVALLAGQGVTSTLGRVERVEVLKGPQGTLFGRNSTGGAISIVTPDPGPDLTADVQSELANNGTLNELVFLNLPIADGLGATLTGYSQQHDPYTTNLAGATVATYSRGGRLKLVWNVTEDLSFNASASYGEQSSNAGTTGQLTRVAPDFSLIIPQDPKLDYHYSENVVGGSVTNMTFFAGGGNWRLPWVDLKFIGSYQHQNSPYQAYDYDGSTLPVLSFNSYDLYFRQSSAELQVLSSESTPLNEYFSWVGGVYYLDGTGGYPHLNLSVANGNQSAGVLSIIPSLDGFINSLNGLLDTVGIGPIAGLTGPITLVSGGLLNTESLSGYFQGTTHFQDIFDLSQELNLILGARVDHESRSLSDNRLGIVQPVGTSMNEIRLIPFSVPEVTALQVPIKVGLQWFPVEQTQLYGSFSRGFTAPTYSTVNFFGPPNAVKGAKTNAYELGAKTELFDRALRLNGAVFYTDVYNAITGFASITSGGVVEFDNVPRSKIKGAEIDATWQPLPDFDPGLVILGSASYLNAKYTKYPDGRGYDPNTGLSFGPGNPVPVLGAARDFSGNDIDRTPHFSYNLGINQSFPLGETGELGINVATNYSDGFFFDPQNAPEYASPSFQLWDASVAYTYIPWNLRITAFGKNLTKELYPASVFVLDTGRFQEPNDPRTFGLRLQYTFGV
ncbi:MAG: TonB-dependent receptor [Hydrocarboniphaga sp.]|uniref:TonB-dependent receptor n=1 Tax=Hydrocarboniphaga sp. TaxID=2033016 RepID=UPI00261650E9|nr:TonB-dependent receptor [Hydrocarboniphaga sp.]MDB5968363.1 TonB-dependent receptor [Hydrocarboniphaga sp.]